MAGASQLLHAAPNYWTYLVDGGHVTSVSYPAGSFLLQAPLVALGLHHLPTDWLDLAAWVATALVLYAVLPAAVSWIAPLLLLSGAFVTSFADGGTDALFLPFLALAVVGWDRFGDADRSRWARWLSPLALGIACSIKQSPWFCVPFLLIGVAAEARAAGARPARVAARYLGLALASFLAINAAFIAWGPSAWWHGTMLPLLSPLVPDGQGLVTLALHGATRGADLHELWLASALALAGLAAAMALAYPVMKRAWLFLVPVVLFVPGRSLSSYLLDFFPASLAAAVRSTPGAPGRGLARRPAGGPRGDRRAAGRRGRGLGVGAHLGTTVAAGRARRHHGAPRGHYRDHPARDQPGFARRDAALHVHPRRRAPDRLLARRRARRVGDARAPPSATVTISPPGYFWAPHHDDYWLVTAYTASPVGVSTTSASRWRYGPR